ncbi:MAG: DegV family protein [Lachnospiraceae bacterium]|nr:DegV family protein [Lachnospiraceae bacterium]
MIKIFADSTCDLSKELVERYNIGIIPLHIVMDGKEYRDGLEITPAEIFKWADANKTTPKTSAISIEDFEAAVKPEIDAGNEVIVFSISAEMSTTNNIMKLTAEDMGAADKISVIDSRNLSTGIGLLVLAAADLVAAGKNREETVKEIERLIPLTRASFTVDILTYLHRGGRCSAVAALAGSVLKLHPKIVVENGKMRPDKKYRGKNTKAIMEYVTDLTPELKKARKERVFITHTCKEREIVEEVRTYLESLGYFDEVLESHAGGVISSHCGPGTLGVLFIAG